MIHVEPAVGPPPERWCLDTNEEDDWVYQLLEDTNDEEFRFLLQSELEELAPGGEEAPVEPPGPPADAPPGDDYAVADAPPGDDNAVAAEAEVARAESAHRRGPRSRSRSKSRGRGRARRPSTSASPPRRKKSKGKDRKRRRRRTTSS